MPGMLTRAPDRTETSSGRARSPKQPPITFSTLASAARTSVSRLAGSLRPRRLNSLQTSVEMVKPAGTGTPRRVISARFAPLPPSATRIFALPCALPPPKK